MSKFNLKNFNKFNSKIMKLTIKQLLDSQLALSLIIEKDLPVLLSFKLGKLVKEVSEELKIYDETRLKKIKEIGKLVDNKGEKPYYDIPEKKKDFWDKEYNLLINQEVEISVPDVNIKELEGIELPAKAFIGIDWLIKE